MQTYTIEQTGPHLFAVRVAGEERPLCWRNTRALAQKMVKHYQRLDLSKYSLEMVRLLRDAFTIISDAELPAHDQAALHWYDTAAVLLARIDGEA